MSALAVLPPLRGPHWVAARQHRTTARAFALVVLVSALLVTGLLVALGTDPEGSLAQGADSGISVLLNSAITPLALLPALVGAFVAGPLVARELESGTYTWLWTQSFSPARWLTARLSLVAAVALSGSTVLVLAFRTARNSLERGAMIFSWHDSAYEMLGPVAVAQCALGIGVGTLVGLLVRRTVPAMVVTGLVVIVVQSSFVLGLRELLWPVRTLVGKAPIESANTVGMWNFAEGMLTADGTRVLSDTCWGPEGVGMTFEQCMAAKGGVTYFVDVHPPSHFWPTQLVETGILLALAVLAVAVAYRVLGRRHAGGTA
ncbi:ABC transporter permease [Streptomyces sp. NPDC091272]|uniref:ABC transporter permease n=1 Tax=Streptomyces sp. NPDC091272 TaxID=3365981 RepID=UPI00380FB1AC